MKNASSRFGVLVAAWLAAGVGALTPSLLVADGILRPPRDYKGSLVEQAQEAIIIFHASSKPGEAIEDMILKIKVEGNTDDFAWVIPFPQQPKVQKADAVLFKELYNYVHFRRGPKRPAKGGKFAGGGFGSAEDVEVLSREIVGAYDVAVVRENTPGKLNEWLTGEGYQAIEDGEDVIKFYRDKGYVFACVKVSDAQLKADEPAELHPLRFTFKTGGRDGIYFPMKMTGLQKESFDVNLYVFFRFWLNDKLNEYGYEHRGFHRKYRDWDGPECVPDAGKSWSNPRNDPFLRPNAARIPNVAKLFKKSYPGQRYYLTNIRASRLDPAEVRKWADDLWLFPYYLNKDFVPNDARRGGPAAAAYAQ